MLAQLKAVERGRSRVATCVSAIVGCVVASGCGTFYTRTTEESRRKGLYPQAQGDFFGPAFYSAVAFDVLVAKDSIEGGLAQENGLAATLCSPCSVGPLLVFPFVVLFDLAFDTVLLPGDLVAWPLGYKRPWPAERFRKRDVPAPTSPPTAGE